jgi:hypothetical protein
MARRTRRGPGPSHLLLTPDHAGTVVGIDPHKRTLTAAVVDARGGIVASEHFRVLGEGHRALEAWARSFGAIARWGGSRAWTPTSARSAASSPRSSKPAPARSISSAGSRPARSPNYWSRSATHAQSRGPPHPQTPPLRRHPPPHAPRSHTPALDIGASFPSEPPPSMPAVDVHASAQCGMPRSRTARSTRAPSPTAGPRHARDGLLDSRRDGAPVPGSAPL